MTTAAAVRAAIAAAIRTALDDEDFADWHVHASPPVVPVVPGIALVPRSPYREPSSFAKEALHLDAVIYVPYALGTLTAMDLLDDAADAITAALDGFSDLITGPQSVERVRVDPGPPEMLQAVMPFTIHHT